MGDWQPIETAPLDTGRIIGWNEFDGQLMYEPYRYGSNRQFHMWRAIYDDEGLAFGPTHWKPLGPGPDGT